jgi:F420-0:gamma-glutamyl ligase
MKLFSIRLPLIKENEPLLRILIEQIKIKGESLKEGDVIVIAEKVIATSQGRKK